MNRAPPMRVMFDRLLQIVGLKESKWDAKGKRMTRGLELVIQDLGPGDRHPIRIQVHSHDGKRAGCNSFLYSLGRGDFARKVWALQDGLRAARDCGVKTVFLGRVF